MMITGQGLEEQRVETGDKVARLEETSRRRSANNIFLARMSECTQLRSNRLNVAVLTPRSKIFLEIGSVKNSPAMDAVLTPSAGLAANITVTSEYDPRRAY